MPPVEFVFTLATVALVLAVVAFVWARRSRSAVRRLGSEMIQLRDRLARAERYYRGRGHDDADDAIRAPTGAETVLEARLATLEGRVREALVHGLPDDQALAAEPETSDARRRILRYLQLEGYERVAFIGATDDGGLLVEAEKGGVTSKGRAEIGSDGAVRIQAVSSVRAFP